MQSKLEKASEQEIRREIAHLAALCMKPAHVWRKELVDALWSDYGFPSFKSRCVMNNLFGKFSECALKDYEKNFGNTYQSSEKVAAFVFPSNVPDPLVEDVFFALLEKKVCVIKLSRRAKKWGEVFLEGIRRESPLLRDAIRWTVSREDFFEVAKSPGVVTAYGDASSVEAVRKGFGRRKVRFRDFGPRLSLGVVFKSAIMGRALEETARRCAWDVFWYDQRGCLSPQVYFVEKSCVRFALALQKELKTLNVYLGTIRRSYDLSRSRRIFIDRWVSESLGEGRVKFLEKVPVGPEPLVALLEKLPFTPGPSGQVVAVKTFGSVSGILSELNPLRTYIQGVSISGHKKEKAKVRTVFKKTSALCFAEAGFLHNPPLGWNRQPLNC